MQRKEENPFYRRWLRQADPDDRRILEAMSDSEAADAFGEPPSFGTGGIRKAEGPGINRINPITVRWAAAATAKALLKKNEAKARENGVVITFDTRVHSRVLAKEAALTVAGFSVPVLLTEEPTPVPFLSFLLKNKDYAGGVMIPASHNPATDNGFKVYNENGGQLIPKEIVVEGQPEVLGQPVGLGVDSSAEDDLPGAEALKNSRNGVEIRNQRRIEQAIGLDRQGQHNAVGVLHTQQSGFENRGRTG